MKSKQIKFGIVLSYISMAINIVVTLIFTPIILKKLGQNDYGLYNLASSVISYLGILNLGFGSSYIKFYSKYKSKNDEDSISKLNGMYFIVFSILICIAFLLGMSLSFGSKIIFGNKLSSEELKKASLIMIILTINLCFSFFGIVFVSYVRSNEKFIFYYLIHILKNILIPLVTYPIISKGYGSLGLSFSITIVSILIEIIYVIYSIKKIKMRFYFRNIDKLLLRELFVYSSFIFIHILLDQINWNLDKFIIGRIKGTVSVAIYSIAAQINTFYLQFPTTISTVFVPKIHKIINEKDNVNEKLTKLFTNIGKYQFVIVYLILSGFYFFGKQFVIWWAGSEYINSYYIALLLITPPTIELIQHLGIEITRAKNMHKFRAFSLLCMSIFNIILSIPLVTKFDALGAAIGTAISLLIGNGIIMNLYYHKKVGLNMIYFWKEIIKLLPIVFVSIFVGFFITIQFNTTNFISYLISIIIYTIIYLVIVWFIALNKEEKKIITSKLSNIFKSVFKLHY